MSEIYIKIPQLVVKEGSAFSATVNFRNGEASEVPTTVKYRVDCLTTGKNLTDWTTVSPSATVTLSITPTENAIQSAAHKVERKQITVAKDPDLTTQVRENIIYQVMNIAGF